MLPTRDGVGPSQVSLPAGHWPRMIDFLVARMPAIPAAEWTARMACGDLVDDRGNRVAPDQAYQPHGKLFYYRRVPDEAPNPAQASVLFEDDLLVAADKPHFLPVTPSGRYLQETLLVRLRRELGIDDLTPLHRIDRETAGVVLFAKQAATRKHYQALFARRAVAKIYQAIAPWHAQLRFPMTRSSKLTRGEHFMQMREADDGPNSGAMPNAHTRIELMQTAGALGRYRLLPLTGKRHQLRVHLAALGLPIVGDRIYPEWRRKETDDIDNPLRLLAQQIAFLDPITGETRCFASLRTLQFPHLPQP